MSLPERRIAADGTAYTYTDFVEWYGQHANKLWEGAAATEHSQNYSTAIDALPELELHAAFVDDLQDAAFVLMQDTETLSTEHGRNATEHSALDNIPDTETTASGHLMQCGECLGPLCSTEDLAFFWQGDVEVHLMLKPEVHPCSHPTFIRSPVTEKGAIASWQCSCGSKFGDTRAVAVQKAPMTAFKSSSVMLCGYHIAHLPSIYDKPPFNTIEVRTRDTFFGMQ